jgi:hypothetical protein
MKAKRDALTEMFDDHHGDLVQPELDQIAFLGRVSTLTSPHRRLANVASSTSAR